MQAFWIRLEPITAKFLHATFNQSFLTYPAALWNKKEDMRTFEDPYCFAQLAAVSGSGTTMATNLRLYWLYSPTSSLCPWIPDSTGAGYLHNLCVMDMPATLSLQRVSIYEALCHERALHLKVQLQHDLTWKWMEIKRKLNGTSFYWMEIDWRFNENKASNAKNWNVRKWMVWVAVKKY